MEHIKNNYIKDKKITTSSIKCKYCGQPYNHIESTLVIFGNEKIINSDEPTCDCIKKLEVKRLEEERARRKKERTEKLFENSMITPFFREKTFDALLPTEEIQRCKEYVRTFNPKTSKGIQMFGKPGTGKTTALAAICNEFIKRDYNCLFTQLSTLLDKCSRHSYSNSGDITSLLQWLTAFDFVVLDDIGRETYTDKRKENVFRIIDTLMNYKVVTAFTANPEMIVRLKTIPELNAALDRLRGMCPIKFEFHGESYRGKEM